MEGISVLICSYNGEATITRVLEALQAQEGIGEIPVEVILVDNASTDDTVQRATKAWVNPLIPFRVLREEEPGISFARRAGHRAARYSLILWVDDDNFLAPGYLRGAFDRIRRFPRAGMCGGCGEAVLPGGAPAWFAHLKGAFAIGPQGETDSVVDAKRGYVYGAGTIIRREALDELDQFAFPFLLAGRKKSELTAGEDTEICLGIRLLGWTLIHSQELKFQHYLRPQRLTWDYAERLFHGFGRSEAILWLYLFFLRPETFKRRVQRLFARAEILKEFEKAKGRDSAYFRQASHDDLAAQLTEVQSQGRTEEVERLRQNGELWHFLRVISDFEKRSRRLRRSRGAPQASPR